MGTDTNVKTEEPYDKRHAKVMAREAGTPQRALLEPPTSWPDKGTIVFENVCARYRPELDLVLDGISFTVEARQKIGVVGRTGSGKSSMMLTLFRILELERGSIAIDGIDISRVGLRQLRRKPVALADFSSTKSLTSFAVRRIHRDAAPGPDDLLRLDQAEPR